jgi:flagellar assembly protein FliH
MSDLILKAAAVSSVTRRVPGRPLPQVPRRERATTETAPYMPQPALAGALPRATETPARPDVEEVRRDMEAFREAARKQAHDTGLAEGRAQGLKDVKAEAASLQAEQAQALADLFKRLEQRFADQVEGLEILAVDVVLTACRKILGDAARTQEGVVAVVKTALAAAAQDEVLQVRLHPNDFARLSGALGQVLPPGLPLRSDDSLAAGGCVVEIAGGSIDARLDTQFKLLAAAVAQAAQAAPEAAA